MRGKHTAWEIFLNVSNGAGTKSFWGVLFSVADKMINDFHLFWDTRKIFKIWA
jgi:hypothetical protein